MSLLVLSSWQGVERPPHNQARLGLMWFEFLYDVALIKPVMQSETSQVKKNNLSTFCRRGGQICDLSLKMTYPLVFHPRWQTTDMLPVWHWQTFHITGVVRTHRHKTRPRINGKNTRNGACCPRPPGRNASTENQFFLGLRHILVLFNPWPLAHLELDSNMRM